MTNPRHFWTTSEDRTLRQFYPSEGRGVAERLPDRSARACATRAHTLGLRVVDRTGRGGGGRKLYHLTPEIEADLRAHYQTPGGPPIGGIDRLAEKHSVPGWYLSREGRNLGLVRDRNPLVPWTDAELAIVREFHSLTIDSLVRRLRRAGFKRSGAAVIAQRRRLGLGAYGEGEYSANSLARMLGVYATTVHDWIESGWLDAERRRPATPESEGRMQWSIDEAEIRRFVIAYPWRVDLAKVTDADWFIGLVAGRAGDGRQHRTARQRARLSP